MRARKFVAQMVNEHGGDAIIYGQRRRTGRLWKSDGTSAGTVLVKDIYSGPGLPVRVSGECGGNALLLRLRRRDGRAFWKSDGTVGSTVLVKDIQPSSIYGGSQPRYLLNGNGTLYFWADDGTNGTELWKSDGTTAGTVMVKDILVGSPGSLARLPPLMTNIGDTVYFTATDGVSGAELWKSNGTAAGTVLVQDINPGAVGQFVFPILGGWLGLRCTSMRPRGEWARVVEERRIVPGNGLGQRLQRDF